MNAHTMLSGESDRPPAVGQSLSIVVVTTVDGTLLNADTGLCLDARATLEVLTQHDVPVVLWSDRRGADVIALQSELGLRHPFVCRGGTHVYVPTLYFPEPIGLVREEGPWTVIDCSRPSRTISAGTADGAQAIRLLVCLYRVYADDVVIVGVGSEWQDRDLLHEVDVPIVISRSDRDQTRLLRRFPDAYVTRACGPAGWCEAILGPGEEG